MENINKKRIYSLIVDIAISNLISMIFFSVMNLKYNFYENSFVVFNNEISFGFSFQIIIMFMYFIIFDIFNQGKSFGKLIFSIKLIRKNSLEELTTIDLLKRSIYKMISIVLLPISIILFLFYNCFSLQDRFSNSKTIFTSSI